MARVSSSFTYFLVYISVFSKFLQKKKSNKNLARKFNNLV